MANFIPIFVAMNARRIAADHEAEAYRRLEEGHASPQPKVRGKCAQATWRFFKIAMMSCTTVMGIKMLVSLFLSRFVYQDDPTLQDPIIMSCYVIAALLIMGAGYIPTLADVEEEEM